MKYRELGKTGLNISEIGFGGEWLKKHEFSDSVDMIRYAHDNGINIIDCWMPDPKSRDIIGQGIADNRQDWIVQGHIGSTYQNGQYVRTRDMKYVKDAFEDLLTRLKTNYIDLGMIHYVDSVEDWNNIMNSDFIEYVYSLHNQKIIRHIGLSTHNPKIGILAANSGFIENILFSINPAFDMRPATEELDSLFESYDNNGYTGIDSERKYFYQLCLDKGIGLTAMKGYFGGRLFDKDRSPFGVELSPVQCIHYVLNTPSVASIMCGYDTKDQIDAALAYENANELEKDYTTLLTNTSHCSYIGQCTYCGHCKPCPFDIDIASINQLYDLAVSYDSIPESILEHYKNLKHHANECIGCKSCESRCPFKVQIAEKMQNVLKLFGY